MDHSNGAYSRRIAIIVNHLGIGGAERVVVDEANELHRRGIPVTLITLKRNPKNSYASVCTLPESDQVCIGFSSIFDMRKYRKLIRLLCRCKPDVVITHLWFSNTIGRIAARIARVPCVISFEHNVYDRVKTRKQFFADRVLQIFTTRIVMATDAIRTSLIGSMTTLGLPISPSTASAAIQFLAVR
jgi:UDP-N-acetylglucosamine:LPS N-acetylglucosamine transferase